MLEPQFVSRISIDGLRPRQCRLQLIQLQREDLISISIHGHYEKGGV